MYLMNSFLCGCPYSWHKNIILILFLIFFCFRLQLVFEGIRGSSYTGDAAIDNVELTECGMSFNPERRVFITGK